MSDSNSILIVDDSEEQIIFVSEILENHGFSYTVARNGAEGLAAMQKEPPVLVLLDIMMPRKSGLNVLKQMREDSDLKSIPVIVISGASEVTGVDVRTGEQMPKKGYGDDVARGFGEMIHEKLQGESPDAFIEKPVDPPLLISKIKELLP